MRSCPNNFAVSPDLAASSLVIKIGQSRTLRPLNSPAFVSEFTADDVPVRFPDQFGNNHGGLLSALSIPQLGPGPIIAKVAAAAGCGWYPARPARRYARKA